MRSNELNILGFVVGAIGIGYAIYISRKMNRICDKINTSLEDMEENIDIDIPNALVEKAINDAVDKEVNSAVEKAAARAIKEVEHDMNRQIKDSVNDIYSDVRDKVTEKAAVEVANIDTKGLQKVVMDRAEEKILEKFDGNLDDVVSKFNRELNSISSIYSSIANTMSNHANNSGPILRLS